MSLHFMGSCWPVSHCLLMPLLLLKFGDIGMLREGILLGILMDTQPLPILRPFGDEVLCSEYCESYFSGDDYNTDLIGNKETAFMGNLCAFQFWQRAFKDKHRVESLKRLLNFDAVKATIVQLPNMEDWCSFHNLVLSSLNHVSDTCMHYILLHQDDDILHSVHRFRPKFLSTSNGLPTYYDPYVYEHTCILTCQEPNGDTDALSTDDRHLEPSGETTKCFAVPYVASDHFRKNEVAKKLVTIVKQMRVQHTEDAFGNQVFNVDDGYHVNAEAPLCNYFLKGLCKWASECRFSHSLNAQRTPCRYFYTLQGCRNGDSCLFPHNGSPSLTSFSSSSVSSSNFCLPEDGKATAISLLKLFSIPADRYILLLDDTDLHFTSKLASFYEPSKIISTTSLSDTSLFDPSLTGVKVLWGLRHPSQTIISKGENQIPWKEVNNVLWFPNLESYGENLDMQKAILQSFFEYLAIRMLGDFLEMRVILTMNNIRFSQLQVEKLGRDSFFFLTESFPFDEISFGELSDKLSTKKPMMASRPTSYIFDLCRPSDSQFGNYAAELHKCLRHVQNNQ